jgi:hypothetical protein
VEIKANSAMLEVVLFQKTQQEIVDMDLSNIMICFSELYYLRKSLENLLLITLSIWFSMLFIIIGLISGCSPIGCIGLGLLLAIPFCYGSLFCGEKILLQMYKKNKLKAARNCKLRLVK